MMIVTLTVIEDDATTPATARGALPRDAVPILPLTTLPMTLIATIDV